MSRTVQEKLTDEQIVEKYKPKVFGIYARNVLTDLSSKEKDCDSKPEEIRVHYVHHNGTAVKRIMRVLYEQDIFLSTNRDYGRINLGLFNKEAPALAILDHGDFQLDPMVVLLKAMGKRVYSDTPRKLTKDSLHKVGGREIKETRLSTALWCYFNQDKIYFSKPDKDKYDYYLHIKNQEVVITRHKLLSVLFEELRVNPTKYLAEFCGTSWVGHISNMIYIKENDAFSIIKNPIQIARAEREIRSHANHFLAYANMLAVIKEKMRGDKPEQICNFLKFMIKSMLRKAPLNHNDFKYQAILENAQEFTFENLFPGGLTKGQIEEALNLMRG